jgi:hypothetical protein
VFRGTKYRFQNNEATYAYSSEIQKGDSLIKDVMTPINLKGHQREFTIFRQRKTRYSEALNSVFFATLQTSGRFSQQEIH